MSRRPSYDRRLRLAISNELLCGQSLHCCAWGCMQDYKSTTHPSIMHEPQPYIPVMPPRFGTPVLEVRRSFSSSLLQERGVINLPFVSYSLDPRANEARHKGHSLIKQEIMMGLWLRPVQSQLDQGERGWPATWICMRSEEVKPV